MKLLVGVSVALLLASLPAAALAQVTQSYSYDGNGRLIGVSTTGSGGTNTAAYAYDDADNRTSRSQTGTSAYAAILSWPINEPLLPNHALVSANGHYSLALRASGDVELRAKSADARSDVTSLATFFLVDAAGSARFQPSRAPTGAEGGYLALADDGELLLRAQDGGGVLWRSASTRTSAAAQ